MLPLSYPARWRIAGIALLLIVLAAAMAPEIWPWMNRGGSVLLADKWAHALTFAMLAVWYSGQYGRRSYGWLIGGLLIFGALIEVCQSAVTYRTAETGDFVADALGVFVGISVALAGLGGWSQRFESWLKNRG